MLAATMPLLGCQMLAGAATTRLAEDAVSSPPIVIRWSTPSASRDFTTLARCEESFYGFAREVWRMDPPWR